MEVLDGLKDMMPFLENEFSLIGGEIVALTQASATFRRQAEQRRKYAENVKVTLTKTMEKLHDKCKAYDDLADHNAKLKQRISLMLDNIDELQHVIAELGREKQILMGTVQTLVHEWLTPEQREQLTSNGENFAEKKKQTLARLTLERKSAQGLHSIGSFSGQL